MDERSMKFRVGVMILATILSVAIIVLLFMGSSPLRSTYTIYIKFKYAPGVSGGTPVRKAGIRIGTVRNVELDDSGVTVTADIESGRHLYSNELCKVTNSFPIGDASLEFVRDGNFQGEKVVALENGAQLQGQTTQDLSGSIAGLPKQAGETLATLNAAGQDLHDLLGDAKFRGDIKQAMAKMPPAFDRIGQTFASLDNSMQNLDRLIAKLEKGMDKLDQASGNLAKFSQDLNDPQNSVGALLHDNKDLYRHVKGVAANLDELSGKLIDPQNSLGALLQDKRELYRHVNGVAANLDELTGKLNDPQNSLGALLHDNKDLYQHVNRLAKNIDDLSRDLKPIVDNVWVFTDKIARHPGDLGVRGALEKDAGFKDSSSTSTDAENGRWPIGGSGQWSTER